MGDTMTNKNKKYPDYKRPNYDKKMSPQLEDQIIRFNKQYSKQVR